MADRFIQLEIFLRGHRFGADFSESLQVVGIFAVDDDRSVPSGLMHDVWCRCVFDMMDLPHIAGDDQDLVGLKLHERGWWDKAVYSNRAPFDLPQDVVHFLDTRDTFKRYT